VEKQSQEKEKQGLFRVICGVPFFFHFFLYIIIIKKQKQKTCLPALILKIFAR